MPKSFYVGVVIYVMCLIAGVGGIAHIFLSSPKKKKTPRHRRRNGDNDYLIRGLVRHHRGDGTRPPKDWTARLSERQIIDKM